VLGLHLEYREGIVRLYDPATDAWLPTPPEEHQARLQAEAEAARARKAVVDVVAEAAKARQTAADELERLRRELEELRRRLPEQPKD